MTNIQINNNIGSEEITMSTTDNLISALISHFQNNPQGFTDFRKEIEVLLKDNIKPLTSRSGKSGDNWRSEVKNQFSGKGAKWVYIALSEIESTLVELESKGIDCTNYRKNITNIGKAWIRFSGPRVKNNIRCAAFEVRTEGSTIDHPKQLHTIPIELMSELIETMPKTPKALKLEEDSAPMPNLKIKAAVKEVKIDTQNVQVIANEINEELEAGVVLNEAPQSDDPAEWEAFLAAEGLTDPDLNSLLNDDEL